MGLLELLIRRREGTEGTGPGATDNCILWLRADRPHPSAPPVVDLSGSLVNTWFDQSGLGNDASSTGGNRPTYDTTAAFCPPFGDLPGIDFLGNDFLVTDELVASLVSPGDVPTIDGQSAVAAYVVYRAGDQNATMLSIRHLADGSSSTDGVNLKLEFATTRIETTVDAGLPEVPVVIPLILGVGFNDGNIHQLSNHYDADLANDEFRLRSDTTVEIGIDLNTSTRLFAESNEVNIGRFGPGQVGTLFQGTLFEILIYTEDDPATRAIVEEYLTSKWCSGLSAPDAPCLTICATSTTSVTLEWDTPDDGGSPITGYKLTRTGGGPNVVTNLGVVNSFVDNTVVDGTSYTYTLVAINLLGESPDSNVKVWDQPNFDTTCPPCPPVPPPTVPDPPCIFFGGTTITDVLTNWTTPGDGGSAITGYTLTRTDTIFGVTVFPLGVVNTFTDTTAPSGVLLNYSVTAENAIGSSSPSNTITIVLGGASCFARGYVLQFPGGASAVHNIVILSFTLFEPSTVILRGLGPKLLGAPQFLPFVLDDPHIELFDTVAAVSLDSNDSYLTRPAPELAAMAAAGLTPTFAVEAAMVKSLPAGLYSLHVKRSPILPPPTPPTFVPGLASDGVAVGDVHIISVP